MRFFGGCGGLGECRLQSRIRLFWGNKKKKINENKEQAGEQEDNFIRSEWMREKNNWMVLEGFQYV